MGAFGFVCCIFAVGILRIYVKYRNEQNSSQPQKELEKKIAEMKALESRIEAMENSYSKVRSRYTAEFAKLGAKYDELYLEIEELQKKLRTASNGGSL